MGRIDGPDQFSVPGVAPGERAGSAHESTEDLGEVCGVQHQQTHATENPLLYLINYRIIDAAMGRVPPPGQHIGAVQDRIS